MHILPCGEVTPQIVCHLHVHQSQAPLKHPAPHLPAPAYAGLRAPPPLKVSAERQPIVLRSSYAFLILRRPAPEATARREPAWRDNSPRIEDPHDRAHIPHLRTPACGRRLPVLRRPPGAHRRLLHSPRHRSRWPDRGERFRQILSAASDRRGDRARRRHHHRNRTRRTSPHRLAPSGTAVPPRSHRLRRTRGGDRSCPPRSRRRRPRRSRPCRHPRRGVPR